MKIIIFSILFFLYTFGYAQSLKKLLQGTWIKQPAKTEFFVVRDNKKMKDTVEQLLTITKTTCTFTNTGFGENPKLKSFRYMLSDSVLSIKNPPKGAIFTNLFLIIKVTADELILISYGPLIIDGHGTWTQLKKMYFIRQ